MPALQRDVAGRAGHRRAGHRRHGAAALAHPVVALLRRRGDASRGEVSPVVPVLLVEVPPGLLALLVPVLHLEDVVLDRADLGEDDVDPVEVDPAPVVCQVPAESREDAAIDVEEKVERAVSNI